MRRKMQHNWVYMLSICGMIGIELSVIITSMSVKNRYSISSDGYPRDTVGSNATSMPVLVTMEESQAEDGASETGPDSIYMQELTG
ncbi:hypothetical protein QL285_003356 [Trifolium repens]|nr:hypothetical protein QL285_003356 [Trifolium repens]